jgi:hypothetical protein
MWRPVLSETIGDRRHQLIIQRALAAKHPNVGIPDIVVKTDTLYVRGTRWTVHLPPVRREERKPRTALGGAVKLPMP